MANLASDVTETRTQARRSNYDLENALGIMPAIESYSIPSVKSPLEDKPEINGWLPAPKSLGHESWVRPSRKRGILVRRFLDISVELEIHEVDVAQLNQKSELVKAVWEFCVKTRQGRERRERQITTRRLAKAAAQVVSHVSYDFDLSYLVCRTHVENCSLIHPIKIEPAGWIPFHKRQLDYWDESFILGGNIKAKTPHLFLPDPKSFCDGSFNQDASGKWYIDTSIEVDELDMRLAK